MLAVLPEVWTRSFGDSFDPDTVRSESVSILERWQAACAEIGIAAYGSLPWTNGTAFTNRAFLIDATGVVAAHYDKLHLFRLLGEHERFQPGKEIAVTPIGPFSAGLSICYDLRFPELYRAQVDAGADLLLICAQWPAARAAHWRALAIARAIENQCWVVAVNRCGRATGPRGLEYHGGSLVVDPWGDVIAELDDRPQTAPVDIDIDRVVDIRTSHPFLADRRRDLLP